MRALVGALAVLVATAAPAPAQTLRRVLEGGVAVTQALDLHSTMRALASGQAREGNPFMRAIVTRPALAIGVKVAGTAALIAWAEYGARHGHPRLVTIALAAASARRRSSSRAIISAIAAFTHPRLTT